ncbi:xanthine dehydrogenase family protein molybdopterin-binding subunit [Mesorhizobium ciceri]|uniref:Aldehyde oxidase and xanthine dehydrogenase molybdopterin binding protein n=1 Tax=Mesorhizobium ciceri biovar biserrulae (strain HAMBI 2942 / LMG 23838 / WSM1271) TaxID=765698 RepID=E8TJE6_MESCW|nr:MULTISPECIES: xanthine dehydrogenase family protein molybdopterin-binding subunit [Mesorhizobium]RVA56021.1 xanthine dehydrogenase family protein molybdopterin-binding subunit [Mesorhizobium sp. M7A.F.Ca.US.001.01.1.1]ADV12586.1 aldehyde oxidase and xanthine dehydrogenase molybdopterin binding protein [Mesorhizobium ciceri biovar biserrulae WSM1271]AMY00847.1 carbon monoxide dehydrogenase [Mesorhizobium ciceri biovar biserrulae]ARP65181.1 carbon monoxide dehydrogenase [Mesorhizobium sp. WSM1
MGIEGVGARVARKEDKRFITGAGRYVDDMVVPGMKHAAFVRSPHAHAQIKKIDVKKAQGMPGVIGVLTGKELKADGIGNLICGWMIHSKDGSPMKMGAWSPLAFDRVRYVGDAVVIVVAETKGQARDAAEAVEITYKELKAVVDASKAMDKGAPQIHPEADNNLIFDWDIGNADDTEAAFGKAAHVVKMDIINNRLVPNAMEPRAALGHYDKAEDHYTCWTTSQNPHVARLVMSAFYNVAPENKLRVIAPDVGGGFGSKIYIYPEEIVCLWASKKTGVPVKWVADRTESFLTDAHGRDHHTHAEMAFDKDHRILGLKVETQANLGAYMSLFSSATPTYLYATLLSGQYNIPAIHANVKAIYTNTAPVDAYRGAGRPEATFVMERMMETAARQFGVSPAELRRKNFVTAFPHQTPVIMCYDAGDYAASLDAAMKASDYAGFAKRKAAAAKKGLLRGIGMSCYIEACGIAPSAAVGSLGAGVGLWESAEVRVNAVGTIEVLTGSHSHGQGHETTFAQLVNERFGVPLDSVSIVHGDTDKVQMGMGTYGSRSGAVGMSAIVKALDKVEAKAKKIAAHLLEADEGDIVIENGALKVAGTDKNVPWFQMALAAYTAHNLPGGMEPGLKETAFYDPSNFTFPAGCYICEVEVDPETGVTEIVQFVAADDFGNIINPMIVEGQVHGGLAQGIGQALLEGAHYDNSGQLLTASYMDYTMPRAGDLPSFKVSTSNTPCPGNPLGIKGCGEAGAIGSPPAVINALTDAIGSNDLAMPASPSTVWAAIRATKH